MRFPDNSLIGDLNDGFAPKISGSVDQVALSNINENETVYDLLPTIINRPPVITKSISEASTPAIKPYTAADATGNAMYQFPDGTVKINLGAKITLRIKAEQPPILNVENGVPTMVNPTQGLTYIWRKDGQMIMSEYRDSLASSVTVKGSELIFDNMQPRDAGTYTCEVSNDIGTTSSEPIVIEVLNLDFDSYFYRNLVKNPYGVDGTNDWSVNNGELLTKSLIKTDSPQDYMQPNKINIFGYTVDMMHPRPYQIESGVIQNLKMTDQFLSPNANYFTRTRYKFEKHGGSFLVRAYQDIDLADIQWLIKGGVYGVEGVRALFSCYIGMALPSFIPVKELISLEQRTKDTNYVMTEPRISVPNFMTAGPSQGPSENVSVYFEEYDNETRLTSKLMKEDGSVREMSERLTFVDPWTKRMWKYWGQKYYDNDIYGLGELSQGDGRDATLFVADELYPKNKPRYTYGQYVEFNKAIIAKLNPQTTKVRITLDFSTTDWRLFEQWRDAYEQGEEVLEFVSWQSPYERHKWSRPPLDWGKLIVPQLVSGDAVKNSLNSDQLASYKNKSIAERVGSSQDPRGMVTGINLALIPVLTQQRDATEYYTSITLAQNDTPESTVDSGLKVGRAYDPFGRSTTKLNLQFGLNVDKDIRFSNLGELKTDHILELSLSLLEPGQNSAVRYDFDADNILPFAQNQLIFFEDSPRKKTITEDNKVLGDYIQFNLSSSLKAPRQAAYKKAVIDKMSSEKYVLVESERAPDVNSDRQLLWNNKVRFEVLFYLPSSAVNSTSLVGSNILTGANIVSARLQKYDLVIDFSDKNNKKVYLTRDTTMPGQGSGTFDLPYEIDPYGKLICKLPDSLVYGPTAAGGWNYPLAKQSITVTDTPINLIRGLRNNIDKTDLTGAYQEAIDTILSSVDDAISDYKARYPNLTVTSFYYPGYEKLIQYKEALVKYAEDGKAPNPASWRSQEFPVALVLDVAKLVGNPRLRNTTSIPSLIAVRPAPIEDIELYGASPSYGQDEFGRSYSMNYLPIKDTAWGTYK